MILVHLGRFSKDEVKRIKKRIKREEKKYKEKRKKGRKKGRRKRLVWWAKKDNYEV